MKDLDLTTIQDLINQFVLTLKDTIANNCSNASGKLSQSIKGKVKQNGKWLEVSISLEDYWKYIEYGTKPHFPPVDKIKEWIRVKPILPRPLSNGKLPTENQLAFLIGRKISKVGTKPRPFLKKSITEFDLVSKMYKIVTDEIEKQLEKEINTI